MAQQVERFTRNEQVGGSNPPTSSKRPRRFVSVFSFPYFPAYSIFPRLFRSQPLFYKKVYKIMYKIMYKMLTEKTFFGIILL